ncbi:alcohol dehydrogenase protein [Botrytis cinerea]
MALNATMRAVLWAGIPFQMNVTSIPMPTIQSPTDTIVKITTAGICGTDLHVYHGVYVAPTAVSNFQVGDRVIIPDSVDDKGLLEVNRVSYGLGSEYGDAGGLQAEYARVPYSDANLMAIPSTNGTNTAEYDNDYLLPGDSVAVFGAGPVGLLAAYSAILRGASRVYSVDHVPERLAIAESIGAVPINFNNSDPVQQIIAQEPGGVMRSLDCVGYEAVDIQGQPRENEVIRNMIAVTAAGGGLGQIGIFGSATNSTGTPLADTLSHSINFPMADFFGKSLTMRSGPVALESLAPGLIQLISSGRARPSFIVSSTIGIEEAPEYFARFNDHLETKVVIRFPDP